MQYGLKSRLGKETNGRNQNVYVQLMLNEDADMALLRLLECFMEAAPQLTLQLYILCNYPIEDDWIIRK